MNTQKNINILLLLIIICISIFGSLIVWELYQSNMQRKSEFSRVVNNDFFSGTNTDTCILRIIEENLPILTKSGGKYNEYDLDDYLAKFEAIKNYLDAGSLNLRDVYNNYAHFAEVAYQCPEINKFIHETRTHYSDSGYYANFEKFARQMLEIDGKIKK